MYSNDVLNGYNDLFMSAHRAMEKNAGIFGRISRLMRRPAAEAASAATHAVPEETAYLRNLAGNQDKKIQQLGKQYKTDTAAMRAEQEAMQAQHAEAMKTQGAQHANELGQYQANPGALAQAQNSGRWAKRIGVGAGVAGLAAAPAAYYYGNQSGAADKTRTRNIAFGAGAAAGLALPSVTRGLMSVAGRASQSGLLPEAAGLNFGNLMGGGGQY